MKNNTNKNTKTNIMNHESMKLFNMLCGYFLCVLIIFSLCQFINIHNFNVTQIISLLIPIIIYVIGSKKTNIKKIVVTISIYLILLLLLPFAYKHTYDLTIDGNSYHKTAIAFLKNGWNPIHESMRSFQKHNDNVIKIDKTDRIDLWVEHYPKATWIIAANIYNYTGNIESGKCITLIFSIMLLVLSYNCLKNILNKYWSIIISILIIINPIVLAQIFSYYVDGIMGILYIIELLLLMNINPKEKINVPLWISLISICSIFVNLKFTGLMYSGVIAAVYYFYWLIENRKDKNIKPIFKRLTISFSIVFITAIFIVGSNSYIQNLVEHHNPLYPLVGKNKVDIITTMQPKSFKTKSSIEKFIISTFSKTENVTYTKKPKLKNPIKIYKEELDELYIPDTRIGGFGPLQGLITILTIIIMPITIIILGKKDKHNLKYIILPFITIIITSIMVGESWWARYVPQLYLLPIATLILLLYLKKFFNKKYIMNIMAISLLIIIIINAKYFLHVNREFLKSFRGIDNDIIEMKNTKNLKIKFGQDSLYGYFYTLNDNNIKYQTVDEIAPKNIKYMYSWRIEVVADEKVS